MLHWYTWLYKWFDKLLLGPGQVLDQESQLDQAPELLYCTYLQSNGKLVHLDQCLCYECVHLCKCNRWSKMNISINQRAVCLIETKLFLNSLCFKVK